MENKNTESIERVVQAIGFDYESTLDILEKALDEAICALKTERERNNFLKESMGKDKHTLIKSNIALNKEVQEIKEQNKRLEEQLSSVEMDISIQEMIEKVIKSTDDIQKELRAYKETLRTIRYAIDYTDVYGAENALGFIAKELDRLKQEKLDGFKLDHTTMIRGNVFSLQKC